MNDEAKKISPSELVRDASDHKGTSQIAFLALELLAAGFTPDGTFDEQKVRENLANQDSKKQANPYFENLVLWATTVESPGKLNEVNRARINLTRAWTGHAHEPSTVVHEDPKLITRD